MALPTLLAGPILRRVEPNSVSVWLAFSTAQTDVQLFIWESASVKKPTIDAASKAVKNETPSYKSAKTPTERMGQNLHIAVVTMEVTGTTPPLKPDMVYSYNVAFPDGTRDLSTEGLLNQKMIAGTTIAEQLPLGYADGFLPSFVLPAKEIKDLLLAHGSCRKIHGRGNDALPHLDQLIEKERNNPAKRPQQLHLTGDQIYADEVPYWALFHINGLGKDLFGSFEKLALSSTLFFNNENFNIAGHLKVAGVEVSSAEVSLKNFSIGFRDNFTIRAGRFTGTGTSNHLLAFAEYCATYLFYWSHRAWPKALTDHLLEFDKKEANLTDQRKYFDEKILPDLQANMKGYERGLDLAFFPGLRDKPKADLEAWSPGAHTEELNTYATDPTRASYLYEQARTMYDFWLSLPKVARVMANVPSYMMFDDHEVTDDWNITQRWRNRVFATATNTTGRNIVRNALMAYTVFQDWGNSPLAYRKADTLTAAQKELVSKTPELNKKRELLDKIGTFGSNLAAPSADLLTGLDTLLGLADEKKAPQVKWHHFVPCGAEVQVIFMDTRTRRAFPSLNANPTLLPKSAFDEVLPAPDKLPLKNPKLVIIVSPVPAIGFPMIEEIAQVTLGNIEGQSSEAGETPGTISATLVRDMEAWGFNIPALEDLLDRMAAYKRVVLLSGDIHYGYSAMLDYWKGATKEGHARFIQLVASSFKQAWPLNPTVLLSGFTQRLLSAVDRLEKHGWRSAKPTATGDVSSYNRAQLRKKPVVLSGHGWRAGASVSPGPEWQWRLRILRDTRHYPEDDQVKIVETHLAKTRAQTPDGSPDMQAIKKAYPEVLHRDIDYFTKGLGRVLAWKTHVGVIDFTPVSPGSTELMLNHRYFCTVRNDGMINTNQTVIFQKLPVTPPGIAPVLRDQTVHSVPLNPSESEQQPLKNLGT